MTQSNFKIEFEIVAPDRVRVFLNDASVGYVRLHDVRMKGTDKLRLTYRDSSSPFKCVIPTHDHGPTYARDLTQCTVEQLLEDSHIYRRVVSAVIRCSLYNSARVELPMRQAA